MRFNVPVNDAAIVGMSQACTYLFYVADRAFERNAAPPDRVLQIAAGHVLEHEVMESHSDQVTSGAVSDPAYYIGMADAVERRRFVLKILDKRAFQFVVKVILKKDIK